VKPQALFVGALTLLVWSWWAGGERGHWPTPWEVLLAGRQEYLNQRLWPDWWASVSRIVLGGGIAIVIGVALGLALWTSKALCDALRPYVNFLRFVSPISWIPLAILWFGIGDAPVIFLIFVSVAFPMAIATLAALQSIPTVLLRVAQDFRLSRSNSLFEVVLPAIWPDLLTAIRMMLGVAWVVLVAAEMIAGKQGLGFGIHDARNGMRLDLVVLYMLLIGATGWSFDRVVQWAASRPRWRWKNG
jgi:NitT/TauT family transport system permease protein